MPVLTPAPSRDAVDFHTVALTVGHHHLIPAPTMIEVREHAPAHISGPMLCVRDEGRVRLQRLDRVVKVGRSLSADIRLDDVLTSRRHALIRPCDDGRLIVCDEGSANGTWLNGERIDMQHALQPGDTIVVGRTELLVCDL